MPALASADAVGYNKRQEGWRMEQNFSGYCRVQDGPRLVFVEDGEPDCNYECCVYKAECSIGREITQFLQEQSEA